jgi:hypothetical protein
MSRTNQLDFINDFEAADRERQVAERQREVTHEIIDQSAADGTVKSLLHMLADFPRRTKDERGNWLITASIAKMESRLGRSRNTVRSYIRLAYRSGFLESLDPTIQHDERTYIIHWRSILDRELNEARPNKQSQDCPTEDDEKDSIPSSNKRDRDCSTEDGATRSTPRPEAGQSLAERWSISEPEVVNLTTSGGQLTGSKTPQTPEETPEDVFKVNTSRKRLNESFGLHQSADRAQVVQRVPKAWPKWELAVTGKSLSDAEQVHQLYDVACKLGILLPSEMNRLNFFSQAAMNERNRLRGKFDTPNGVFASNVYKGRWWHTNQDIDRGKAMMREAERYVRRSNVGDELERQKKLALELVAQGK